MANKQYIQSLNRLISNFLNDFIEHSREQYTDESGNLSHPGEFGASRERICLELFKNVIPRGKGIKAKGFIMNSNDKTSKEQDLVFFSEQHTPILTTDSDKFFPIETVVGIGQVKSVIHSKSQLEDILNRLSEVKKMRDNMGHSSVVYRSQSFQYQHGYDPSNSYDQVFTFLVCEEMDFSITAKEVDELYPDDIQNYFKHNILCDLKNGVYAYKSSKDNTLVGAPMEILDSAFKEANENHSHIKHLLTNLQMFLFSSTVYYVDMGHYVSDK